MDLKTSINLLLFPMKTTITENDAGQRLDRFLRKAFKATPFSLIHKALRTGKIRVNGKKGGRTQVLSPGDEVASLGIDFKSVVPMNKKLDEWEKDLRPMILFEDPDYLILNKPSGLPVHPGAYHEERTLIDLIKAYLSEDQSLTFQPALAHRLDKGASGAIVAAKSARALRLLAEHFRKGSLSKRYLVIVQGLPHAAQGRITKPLPDKEGKLQEALTEYRVLKAGEDQALLEVTIKTGRLHQIRRHLSDLGFPVLGDPVYGGKKAARLMLHAQSVKFFDWSTGKTVRAEAPPPEEFEWVMKRWGRNRRDKS
jgi:23S rRNA pseudouridine955/2504/2580 synthase